MKRSATTCAWSSGDAGRRGRMTVHFLLHVLRATRVIRTKGAITVKLFTWHRCSALVVSADLLAAATTTSAFASSAGGQASKTATSASAASLASAAAAPSSFHGVNWADPNDNYYSGPVVPSGLSTSDSYHTVYRITQNMVAGFRKNLGANTLRLPINPASVGTAWWNSYRATIDAATAAGDKVILSYWDATSSNNGKIDDTTTWNQMWNTVTADYGKNPRVFFEPMNEPYGYTLAQWVQICTQWLADRTDVPRDRVVIAAPATTTMSQVSEPPPPSTARCSRCTSTGTGPTTRPRRTGSTTCFRASAPTPTARSSTRPARR